MGLWDYAKWAIPGVNAYYGLKALSASPARDAMQRAGAGYEQRGEQLGGLAEQLRRQAAGEGPSLANETLRQALEQNISAQRALAASARPGQQGLATRMMAQQTGQLGAQTAAQGALARLQEQQAAQGQLGQVLLGARGQDASLLGAAAAQPTTGERLLGAAAGLGGAALMSDVRAKQGIAPGAGAARRFMGGLERGLVDEPNQVWDAEVPPRTGYGQGVAPGYARPIGAQPMIGYGPSTRQRMGAALMDLAPSMSDRALKRDVRSGRAEAERFVDLGDTPPVVVSAPGGGLARRLMSAVEPATYSYRPGTGLPPGRRLGVMAQDIERAAPEAVIDTPRGKMVDYAQLGPAMMAGLSDLHRRLRAVESDPSYLGAIKRRWMPEGGR